MADDVVLNKCSVIERCIRRIQEEYDGEPAHLFEDLTRQDSIVLNLQRACQAAIDLAMHVVKLERMGTPQESRDAFRLLREGGILDDVLGLSLEKMVGFRNVAIHDYEPLNVDVIHTIITRHLSDFEAFCGVVVARYA